MHSNLVRGSINVSCVSFFHVLALYYSTQPLYAGRYKNKFYLNYAISTN